MKIASRFTFLFSLLVLLSGLALASSTCDSTVTDNAGVLGGKISAITAAAGDLSSQGADARVVTFNSIDGTLDKTVLEFVGSCPALQAPNSTASRIVPKSNIVIVALAVPQHKFGIFAGKSYEDAFNHGRIDKYKSDFMLAHLRAGEYDAAVIAPMQQMTERLKVFKSEANAPVTNTTTTINQASAPTSLTGLWIFFWILGLVIAAIVVFSILRARRAAKDALEQAQQDAIAARDEAANLISELGAMAFATMTDFTGKPGLKAAYDLFNTASASYSRLAGNLSADPTAPDLGKGTYESLTTRYNGIASYLNRAKDAASTPEVDPASVSVRSVDVSSAAPSMWKPRHGRRHYSDPTPAPAPVVVNNNSGPGFVEGVILGDVLANRSEEREPEREEPVFSASSSSDDSSSSSKDDDESFTSSSSSSDSSSSDDSSSFSSDSSSSDFGSSSDSSSSFSSDSGSSFSSDSGSSSW